MANRKPGEGLPSINTHPSPAEVTQSLFESGVTDPAVYMAELVTNPLYVNACDLALRGSGKRLLLKEEMARRARVQGLIQNMLPIFQGIGTTSEIPVKSPQAAASAIAADKTKDPLRQMLLPIAQMVPIGEVARLVPVVSDKGISESAITNTGAFKSIQRRTNGLLEFMDSCSNYLHRENTHLRTPYPLAEFFAGVAEIQSQEKSEPSISERRKLFALYRELSVHGLDEACFTTMADAYSWVGEPPVEILDNLLNYLKLGGELDSRSVANTIQNLMYYERCPRTLEIAALLTDRALDMANPHKPDKIAITQLVQGLSVLGLDIPGPINVIYRSLGTEAGSKDERAVRSGVAKTLKPHSELQITTELIDGFDSDILVTCMVSPTRLRVELDGPFHDTPRRQRHDTLASSHLDDKHGIETVRYHFEGHNRPELIEAVCSRVRGQFGLVGS